MIGVIFTGGTIGSSISDGYISTDPEMRYMLLKMYKESCGYDDFVTDAPCTILSENINCNDFVIIANAVHKMMIGNVEGIILTHGSDTIQYTASFLSCIEEFTHIPVMVVCSNYVLTDNRANGLRNFSAAVDFIRNKCGNGVFVPYTGRDGITKIYYGNTLLRHHIYSDEIYTVNDCCYGDYAEGGFSPSGQANPCKNKLFPVPAGHGIYSDVLILYPYPGMKYPDIKEYKAVILCTYHSGTICTASEKLKEFMQNAVRYNIPVYLVGNGDGTDYESCRLYDGLGIKILKNITEITAYTELILQIN